MKIAEGECDVQGCGGPREDVFVIRTNGGEGIERLVCAFHRSALEADEPFALSSDERKLLVGADLPLEIINLKVRRFDVGETVVEFGVGHDGIEEQRFTFRMTPHWARRLCELVADSSHVAEGKSANFEL